MKRKDGVIVPDNYERWEQMQREKSLEVRITLLEKLVNDLRTLLDDDK